MFSFDFDTREGDVQAEIDATTRQTANGSAHQQGEASSRGTRAKNMESHLQEEIPLAQSDFNQSKIAEIQGRFQGGCVSFSRGPPFVEKNGSLCISAQTLLVPGRIFIREGTLLKVCRRCPKPRHFFLFNDVLVIKERMGVARL